MPPRIDYMVYRPVGCGYVMKCKPTPKSHTMWIHKTYASLVGIKSKLANPLIRAGEDYYIYKAPEMELVACVHGNGRGSYSFFKVSDMLGDTKDRYLRQAGAYDEEAD